MGQQLQTMTPQELITRLRYLAEQAPIDAVLFRVPCAPACTDHHMRLDVSPRDVLDLCEWVEGLDCQVEITRLRYENPA